MNRLSVSAFPGGKAVTRLLLALALVFSQSAAVIEPVMAQEGEPVLVEARLDLDALPAPISPSAGEITTSASAARGVVDTTIYQSYPNDNDGFGEYLQLGYAGGTRQRGLIEPSLSKLPPNATITNASFHFGLCGYHDYIGASRTITLRRNTSPWHQSLATWNRTPTTGEIVGTKTFNMPNLDPDDDGYINYIAWYEINITTLVNNWLHGAYPNYGFMMTGLESLANGNGTYLLFCSNDTYYSPYLSIEYTTTAPTLASTPSALSFAYEPGDPTPETKQIKLSNNGSTPFNWQADLAAPASWVQFSPSSGLVGPGSSQTINVSVDTAGLSQGTYSGQINLTSTTPSVVGFPRSVPVTLSIANFDQNVWMPVVSKAGTTTQTPTGDVVTLVIGISSYLYIPETSSTSGERAGAWGDTLYFAGLDSTKETRTLRVFGLQHDKDECNCSGGITTSGLSLSSLPDASNNILTLTDSQATYENIEAAFAWLDEHEGPNTTVQIFYSGHGGSVYDEDGDETQDNWDEFIAAYDTNLVGDDYINIVTDDQLNEWLGNLESTKVAVVLDSCFSGGMIGPGAIGETNLISRGLRPIGGADAAAPPLDQSIELASDLAAPGREVLTASSVNESSFETDQLQQGVFSYYLLMALLSPSSDTNHDGIVSVEEAYNYLNWRVYNYVNDGYYTQTPQFYDGIPGTSVGLSWSTAVTSPCH